MADEFFWYELMTSDQDAAVDFYTKVVGWSAAPQQAPAVTGIPYMILSAGERGIGGILQLSKEMKAGGAGPAGSAISMSPTSTPGRTASRRPAAGF